MVVSLNIIVRPLCGESLLKNIESGREGALRRTMLHPLVALHRPCFGMNESSKTRKLRRLHPESRRRVTIEDV